MKILMMTNTYFPIVGGLERSIESFSNQFREWGHHVLIATPQMEDTKTHHDHVIQIPAIRHFNQTDFSLALPLPGLIDKIENSFKPDVIHAHHPFFMGELALRMAAKYSKPVVYTHHIMLDQYERFLPIPSPIAKPFLTELAVGFANLADYVIAPSESVRETLNQEGTKTPIQVVPTGINISSFKTGDRQTVRKRFGISEKDIVVGHVGRLIPEKNIEFLTDSVIDFIKSRKNAYFFVAGIGSMETVIQKKFSEAGLSDQLHMLGVVQGKDLADVYKAMDVFAFSSKSETQGIVVAEAMACGLPVVALDGPGVREVVKDSVNGRLLSHEDIHEFASALDWCIKNRENLQKNAKKTADLFSLDICAKRALQVYKKAKAKVSKTKSWKDTLWYRTLESLKLEWKLLANLGHAAGKAFENAASHIGEDRKGDDAK